MLVTLCSTTSLFWIMLDKMAWDCEACTNILAFSAFSAASLSARSCSLFSMVLSLVMFSTLLFSSASIFSFCFITISVTLTWCVFCSALQL
ncbi:hypothetical protein FPQ18DRAFT_343058 [Pyronema domesticum]|nr:hypothetical protein FPQ18DRAFT_343058 [Pyronema domesticum]